MTNRAATPIPELGRRAKEAARRLASASTAQKDAALRAAADGLEAASDAILAANAVDVAIDDQMSSQCVAIQPRRRPPEVGTPNGETLWK